MYIFSNLYFLKPNWYAKFYTDKLAGINTLSYSLPQNPKEMIFDYYISTYFTLGEPKSEKIADLISYVRDTLITQLKNKFLKDVLYSISAEFRHSYEEGGVNLGFFASEENAKLFSEQEKKFYDNYLKSKSKKFNIEKYKEIIKKNNFNELNNAYSIAYVNLIETLNSDRNTNLEEFVSLAKKIFIHGDWDYGYGGEAWAKICQAWLNLYRAKSQGEIQKAIEYIVTLQHNSGTVFDKLHSYMQNDSVSWIELALNLKAQSKSPYDLLPYCSPKMKQIAPPILKDILNSTTSSYPEEEKYQAEIRALEKTFDKSINGHEILNQPYYFELFLESLYESIKNKKIPIGLARNLILDKINGREKRIFSILNNQIINGSLFPDSKRSESVKILQEILGEDFNRLFNLSIINYFSRSDLSISTVVEIIDSISKQEINPIVQKDTYKYILNTTIEKSIFNSFYLIGENKEKQIAINNFMNKFNLSGEDVDINAIRSKILEYIKNNKNPTTIVIMLNFIANLLLQYENGNDPINKAILTKEFLYSIINNNLEVIIPRYLDAPNFKNILKFIINNEELKRNMLAYNFKEAVDIKSPTLIIELLNLKQYINIENYIDVKYLIELGRSLTVDNTYSEFFNKRVESLFPQLTQKQNENISET